ncbi:hypothetical protein [Krasilnikovia sp. MM14-A1004]|uniref:hypothetical protein n=1 Tax=Krasilnikovia sp. MM14-A1004 TaxID=3373541 RepID=UPI00399D2DCE
MKRTLVYDGGCQRCAELAAHLARLSRFRIAPVPHPGPGRPAGPYVIRTDRRGRSLVRTGPRALGWVFVWLGPLASVRLLRYARRRGVRLVPPLGVFGRRAGRQRPARL